MDPDLPIPEDPSLNQEESDGLDFLACCLVTQASIRIDYAFRAARLFQASRLGFEGEESYTRTSLSASYHKATRQRLQSGGELEIVQVIDIIANGSSQSQAVLWDPNGSKELTEIQTEIAESITVDYQGSSSVTYPKPGFGDDSVTELTHAEHSWVLSAPFFTPSQEPVSDSKYVSSSAPEAEEGGEAGGEEADPDNSYNYTLTYTNPVDADANFVLLDQKIADSVWVADQGNGVEFDGHGTLENTRFRFGYNRNDQVKNEWLEVVYQTAINEGGSYSSIETKTEIWTGSGGVSQASNANYTAWIDLKSIPYSKADEQYGSKTRIVQIVKYRTYRGAPWVKVNNDLNDI